MVSGGSGKDHQRLRVALTTFPVQYLKGFVMSERSSSDGSQTLSGQSVLSLPASNSLEFLEAAFACWREGRLFSITRSPDALEGLGLQVECFSGSDSETGGWGRLDYQPNLSDAPAQIVFSSGTEGRPKAILISHRNLADVVLRLNEAMQVTDEIREYIGVPVTYSFGLGRARAVAAAGGAFFLPERFDPVQIRDMLAANEINAVSAVPSLWRMVLANPQIFGEERDRLRWIEIGSQYMSAADKLALRKLFPNARILQHYGLTEASRSSFLDISAAPEAALESVGQAVGSVGFRIDAEGAIAIRGDHIALGRLEEGGRVRPLTDDEGWLVTRDRGEIREGWLYYLGRLDDQINLAGIKIAAEGLESEIRTLVPAAGEHFAISPVPDPARGEAVLLAIESEGAGCAPLIEAAARMALGRRGVAMGQGSGGALKLMQVDHLPRTGTNKAQRRLLPDLWAAQTPDEAPADPSGAVSQGLNDAEARLADIWAKVIGHTHVTPVSSFYDAGGDSLSSVQVGLVMEEAGLPRPVIRATLEGQPLRDIAALLEGEAAGSGGLSDAARRSWAITMTRALMALSVLISHWAPGVFARLGIEKQAENALAFIYRMGTPGFAAVFGIGIGYFMLPGFADKRVSVLRRMNSAFRLVIFGMVLLAAINLLNLLVRGQDIDGLDVAHGFYNVLAYYALMMGTARWWMPVLGRLTHPIAPLTAGLPCLWLLWQLAPQILPAEQLNSVLEWPRLMLGAGGYNIFKMTAVASVGAAVGFWFSRQSDTRATARIFCMGGAFGIATAAFTMIEAYGIAAFMSRGGPFTSLPGLVLYLSIGVFCIGVFLRVLMVWETLPSALRWPLQLLVVTGGLALPIYVFHGLVMPARDLLQALGLSGAPSLAIPMTLFLLVMGYAARRLWRMYYA